MQIAHAANSREQVFLTREGFLSALHRWIWQHAGSQLASLCLQSVARTAPLREVVCWLRSVVSQFKRAVECRLQVAKFVSGLAGNDPEHRQVCPVDYQYSVA